MRALVIGEHGGIDVLRFEERPVPERGPGDVLVEVKAIGLNHLDTWVRRGVPGHKFPLPLVPGCDGAGVVRETGSLVTHVRPGDRVFLAPGVSCGVCPACVGGRDNLCRRYGILGEMRDGTCAEYVSVPGRNAIPIPEALSFEEAAAFPLAFLTAWHMVVARAGLRPGETVLVHAAGSGVSSAAIQVCGLFGARRILVTAGSEEKLAKARDLGATDGILYLERDFAEEVRRITGKRGVDVILDHVGADTFDRNVRSLVPGGRLVLCGATSGYEGKTDLRFVFFKNLSILGSTMGSLAELHEIASHIAAGRLRPVVDSVLPLSEVKEAHRRMGERSLFGKIVLRP
ncbi:MAG TPA: zinc-binding dehydrogenase [Planctomycetota bacterium]|jgi:NADPH:quinone reductase-like Zn-dependent oxidoreductase|nr:zinc-binding dehydrogenase [Planctomycetota bacterium]